MKRTGLYLLLLCCAVCTHGQPAAGNGEFPVEDKTPVIACDQPAAEFGELDQSVTIHHTFHIRNAGTAPLLIGNVRTTCGCTVAQVGTNAIAPGASTEVTVSLSLAGRRGLQNKSIMIQSNDPKQPEYILNIVVTAVAELALDPPFVTFGNIMSTTNVSTDVTLITRRPGVKLLEAHCESPYFRVEILPEEPDLPRKMRISTVPPLPIGQVRGLLRVRTDHPQIQEVTASVMTVVLREIRALPDELILRGEAGERTPRLSLLLIPGSVREYQVLGVTTSLAGVETRFFSTAPGTYRVDLLNVPTGPEANGQTVRIRTNLANMPEIEIPIRHMNMTGG